MIELIEYLPEKILVLHAEKIAPVVIYSTRKNDRMVEENHSQQPEKDEFDYTKAELISKLSSSLP